MQREQRRQQSREQQSREQRQRYNTEDELHIVRIVNNHSQYRDNVLYNAVYNKYYWNGIMCALFLAQRLINIFVHSHTIYLYEWFNDPILFLIANNYLYKRIHWNNIQESYFNTNYKNAALILFLIAVPLFGLVNDFVITSFYISKHTLTSYTSTQVLLFYAIILYTLLNQIVSFYTLYMKKAKFLVVQLMKYAMLAFYVNIYNLLELCNIPYTLGTAVNTDTVVILQEESFEVEYHIHHWFYALCLIVLTELPEPYHTFIQYIHYVVYLHGVSYYGYDTLIN